MHFHRNYSINKIREYYIERLRSYGDLRYFNIANQLDKLRMQFGHFNPTNFDQDPDYQKKKEIYSF